MENGGDILQLCRLCLVKDDVNISIFEEQGDIRQILQKISSCLPVKVSREDKLPKKICDGCSYKLDMFYEFWNSTANAEKQLLSWLGEIEMKSKLTDGAVASAVAAQQMKPAETVVKQEAIDPSDIHTEENDDDKSYTLFPQGFSAEEAGSSATAVSNEEPPPKRARRTAAVKAQIAMDPESDDDDDSGEPVTKVEDESEESEGDDRDPPFVDAPSTSADDQPGPSGVGKDGAEAPVTDFESFKATSPKIEAMNVSPTTIELEDSSAVSTSVVGHLAKPISTALGNQYMLVLPQMYTLNYVRHPNNSNVTLMNHVSPSTNMQYPITNVQGNSSVLMSTAAKIRPTINLASNTIVVPTGSTQIRPTVQLGSNTVTTSVNAMPVRPTVNLGSHTILTPTNTINKNVFMPSLVPLTTKTLLINSNPKLTSQNVVTVPVTYLSTATTTNKIITLPRQTSLLTTNINRPGVPKVVLTSGQALPKSDKPFPPGYRNPFDYSNFKPSSENEKPVGEPTQKSKSTRSSNKWTCMICSTKKESKEALLEHYEFHKEEEENSEAKNSTADFFECPVCFKQFETLYAYRRHVRVVHGEKEFFCEACNKCYSDAYSLSLHNYSKHPSTSRLYSCCVCKEFECKFPIALSNHIHANHGRNEIYKCDVCEETFSSITWLKDHKIFHTGSPMYECKLCKKRFSHSRFLVAHNKENHASKASTVAKFRCDSCKLNFADKKALLRHLRAHSTEESLCFVCGKTFGNEKKLNFHLLVHAGVKKHVCNVCGKSFLKSNTLVTHLRTHTGEKPYSCPTCGKCFSQRTPLVIHQRHHTGEKPYVCPTCKKGYVSKSALSIHRRTCK